MTKKLSYTHHIPKYLSKRLVLGSLAALITIAVVTSLWAWSSGAISSSNAELENGDVVPPAVSVSDAAASSGKAVQFGSASPPNPSPTPPSSGGRAVTVTNGEQLAATLADARPGDVITMQNGIYTARGNSVTIGQQTAAAKFRITKSGTADKPITLQGTRQAIIDGKPSGDGTGGDYGLHIFKANYWVIKGIRITNQKKGLMLDGSNYNTIDGVMVDTVGQEAVHFRAGSSYNTIKNSLVTKTGYSSPGFGEAIYIGSDGGNWDKLFMGTGSDKSDQSDHNQVLNNNITEFTGEGIDVKEASSFNLIKGNYFDGSKLGTDPGDPSAPLKPQNSADSWIDIKGDNNTITENSGINVPPLDKNSAAFQTHVHGPSGYNSAANNIFTHNRAISGNHGYGFWIDTSGKGNVLSCTNAIESSGAGKGFSNLGGCKETGN